MFGNESVKEVLGWARVIMRLGRRESEKAPRSVA